MLDGCNSYVQAGIKFVIDRYYKLTNLHLGSVDICLIFAPLFKLF